jgi:hypothetical protein
MAPLPQKPTLKQALLGFCIVLALGPALSSCGMKPFVDGRREAGQKNTVGPSTPDRVAVCYSSQGSTPAEILALAKEECAKTNRTPVFDGQDQFQCALFAPTRAYFKCVAP